MSEEAGLPWFLRVEAIGTAIRIRVPHANGPGGIVALVVAGKVSVAIREIGGGVAPFLERAEHLRAGSGPVGRGNQAFESQLAQERIGFGIESGLELIQEPDCVLVAG